MNKKIFLALPLCILAFQGTSEVTAQSNCVQQTIPAACSGGGRITINNNTNSVSPPNLCASPGQTIDVNVVPGGSASIAGKDGGWPSGSGSSFSITAPSSGNYDYNVYFDDGSCLDPRISVGG
jgi:hypothetical protein